MPVSDEGTRKLPYPLSTTLQPIAETPNDGTPQQVISGFPDETTKVAITMTLSLDEYVALATAVDVGRDIAFGEDSELIWWIWCRAFSEGTVMSCEDIADCIDTSEEVQNAITTNYNITIELLMQNANSGVGDIPSIDSAMSTIMNTPQAIGASKDEPIKDLPQCDLNKLWAGIRDGIVQRLDDNARSVLEWLVSKADVAERATALIGAIPIFGSMAQAVLDQMVELAPDMLNLFEAYSSIANMDEIACEIFGLVCAECRYPTYEEVFSYYASAGITGINDLDDIVIAAATDLLFASTDLAALAFYHTIVAYELLVLALGSKFYGYSGNNAVFTMASLGEDFSNDNWLTLCDTCNEDYQLWTWDFVTQGQGEFYPDPANTTSKAIFETGKGWRAVPHSTSKRFNVNMPFDETWEIRAAAMAYDGTGATDRVWYRRPTWGSATGQQNSSAGFSNAEWEGAWEGYLSVTGYKEVGFYATCPTADDIWLTKVSILFNTGASKQPAIPTTDITPYSTP